VLHHTEPTAPEIARRELSQFLRMAERVGLDAERQRRSLRLSQDDWQRWVGILHDAPMPSYPALPVVLRHLGYLNHRLERAAGSQVHMAFD
jgi:hypothetical protein